MYSKETTPSRCLNSLCKIFDIAARQRCLFSFFLSKYLLPQEFQPSLSWDLYFQKAIIRDLRLSRVIRILVHSLKTKETNKHKAPRAFLRPPQLEKIKAPQLKQHGGSDSVNIRDAIVFSGGLRLQFIKCGSFFLLLLLFLHSMSGQTVTKVWHQGHLSYWRIFHQVRGIFKAMRMDRLIRQPLGTSIDFDAFDGQNDTKLCERVCCCCYFWHQREGTPIVYFLHLPAPTNVPFSFFLFFSFKFWISIRTYWASSCWKATQAAWMCTVCYFKSCVTLKKRPE